MERFDAVVVGAGPAGSTLALRLGRAGRSVLLLDAARFPREKPCGEGILPAGVEALRALGLWERVRSSGRAFYGIRYRLTDGTSAEAAFPGGQEAWGCPRLHLDATLLQAARETPGVTVREETALRGFERTAEGMTVALDEAQVACSILVGADGLHSTVRRLAGLEAPPPARPRFGVQVHAAWRLPDPARVEVLVGDGHELYLTPIAEDATCVALLLPAERLQSLEGRGRLEEGLRAALLGASGPGPELSQAPFLTRPRGYGPLAQEARAAHAERLLLVGDAAGALDPITGEGVALSLVTGAIAAEVLAAAFARGDFSAARLSEWTRRRAEEVRALARLTSLLLSLSARPWLARRVVKNLARSPATLERLLGVASGSAPLGSLGLRDGLAIVLGV